jgi:hypothetical protein
VTDFVVVAVNFDFALEEIGSADDGWVAADLVDYYYCLNYCCDSYCCESR